jgi:hypothetical protein
MAIQHIPEIINDPTLGVPENEFAIADTWVIDSYNLNDWNGNYVNVAEFYSDTSGSQVTISLSAIGNISVSYVGFQDINFIDGTVSASRSFDRGNNSGIVFLSASGGETYINTMMNGSAVKILRLYMDGMCYISYIDSNNNLKVDRRYFDNSDNIVGLSATIT